MSMLPFHPLANVFPLMEGKEYSELVEDIGRHGLREPIIILDNMVLDGRNRYRACIDAGVEPSFIAYGSIYSREWDEHNERYYVAVETAAETDELEAEIIFADYGGPALEDPVSFVVSLNLRRRHLDESQRALVAARLATLRKGANQHTAIAVSSVPQEHAATLLNVSADSIQRARTVLDRGASELIEKVERGTISVSAAADVARLPEPQQREIVAKGEREILEAAKRIRAEKAEQRRDERIERLVEISRGNKELATDQRYPVIYADPPWRYEHIETESRAIENQYPTMNLDAICAMPVADLATEDAILFLWTTAPKLEEAFRVLSAWGFGYRTCAIWDKQKIGMGYYFRVQHELLLVATRGSMPTPAPSDRPSSLISLPRTEHSAKPAEFYSLIETFYPTLPKIELFCRSPRQGWAVWGNQASEAA